MCLSGCGAMVQLLNTLSRDMWGKHNYTESQCVNAQNCTYMAMYLPLRYMTGK